MIFLYLRVVLYALIAVTLVPIRRLRHGPRRPTWSLKLEVFQQWILWINRYLTGLPKIERERAGFNALTTPHPHLPGDVTCATGQLGGVTVRFFEPPDPAPGKLGVYFNGGGYVHRPSNHDLLIARLAAACECTVVAVNYALAPEAPFPQAVKDTTAVYRALLDAKQDPSQMVFMGDSAGGGLTVASLLVARESNLPMPGIAVLISPWLDLTCDRPSQSENAPYDLISHAMLSHWAGCYAGDTSPHHPLMSPLFGRLEDLPPLFIQAGQHEILIDQIKAFAQKAQEAEVSVTLEIWPDMFHDFQLTADLVPEGTKAIDRIGEVVRREWSRLEVTSEN